MSSQKLAGKVAVVTGASKGIGAEIAKHLAAEGAAIVVNYSSSKAGADQVVADIVGKGGKAVAVQADMTQQAQIERLFSEAKQSFDRIDVLVNNAGIYEFSPLESITAEHFHKQFDLNVLGLLFASQAAAKHFGQTGGSIINISSVVATMAVPNASVYSATKAGVNAITRSLAKELGPRKIRVNSINPGMVETEGVHAAGIAESDFRKQIEEQTPLGRIGQPRDIAPAAVYLASDDSAWITGESFYISGGLRATQSGAGRINVREGRAAQSTARPRGGVYWIRGKSSSDRQVRVSWCISNVAVTGEPFAAVCVLTSGRINARNSHPSRTSGGRPCNLHFA